jgi:hypothetical protein
MSKPGPKAKPFWSLVDIKRAPESNLVTCWEWQGSCFSNGYGRTIVARKSVGAHRRAYELAVGEIPEGISVCHRCDNRRCVRPSHLFLGTPKDNLRDMVEKGRSLSGERNPNAKLTATDAAEIRRRYAAGGITQRELAEEYGVVEGCVWNVIHNRVHREEVAA